MCPNFQASDWKNYRKKRYSGKKLRTLIGGDILYKFNKIKINIYGTYQQSGKYDTKITYELERT